MMYLVHRTRAFLQFTARGEQDIAIETHTMFPRLEHIDLDPLAAQGWNLFSGIDGQAVHLAAFQIR